MKRGRLRSRSAKKNAGSSALLLGLCKVAKTFQNSMRRRRARSASRHGRIWLGHRRHAASGQRPSAGPLQIHGGSRPRRCVPARHGRLRRLGPLARRGVAVPPRWPRCLAFTANVMTGTATALFGGGAFPAMLTELGLSRASRQRGRCRCRSSTASPTCTARSPRGGTISRPPGTPLRRPPHRGLGRRQAQKLRLRRGGDRHRADRRGRRHPRPQAPATQGGRAARRHGCAADRGGDRPALPIDGAGQDARLRP